MESTRRLRRDLGYEVAKLHGLQQTFERAPDDAAARALSTQIRVQAGVCLKVLDDYQSSVGSRMWSDAERMCRPFRDELRRTERVFRANAGEWDGGAAGRSSLQRAGNWVGSDFYESTGDAVAVASDESPDTEVTSHVMVAPPLRAASHLHDDLDLLLALFDDEEPDGATAVETTTDLKVAPPVAAEEHPREDPASLTAIVEAEEPDGATAIDTRADLKVAPPVPTEAHPREDPASLTAIVDDEELEAATATDATPDVIVAPPVLVEAHSHEDLASLTALADDEEPDGAAVNDALRFTLPMGGGSAEQTLLVLVPSKTGLVYAHQYGGLQCRYAEIEGFLVPAWVNREARAALDRLFLADLGGNGVQDEDRSEAVKKVRDTVEQIWYRGTGDRMVPLQVDDARADELDEAWIPVVTPDGPAYLAWSNSD